jgi:hypothetical protein
VGRWFGGAGLTALVAALVAAAPAAALDAQKPATPCRGPSFTDPPGDAVDLLFQGAQDNMDLLGGFFKTERRANGLELTANLVISDLSRKIPPVADAVEWQMSWTRADSGYYVAAHVEGAATTFSGVVYDPVTGLPSDSFDTRGKLFEGKRGVVQIEIPSSARGAAGANLTDPYGTSYEVLGAYYSADDYAPDEGYGKPYTVAPCPAPIRLAVSPKTAKKGKKTRFGFTATARQAGRSLPLEGAAVAFAGRRATTNSRGRAAITTTFSNAGRYRATATKTGFKAGSTEIQVTG